MPGDPEARVRAALDGRGVAYEVLPCDPALADTEQFCKAYGIPPDRSANTILVASRSDPRRHAACVLLATTRLDVNRAVRKLLGVRKLSFASGEETLAVTGMMLGGVTPFGLPPDVPVYVDARVLEPDWVVLGGGSRSCKLKIDPAALAGMDGVTVVPDLAIPA